MVRGMVGVRGVAVVGMVFCSVWSTSHAARSMSSAVEIVGIAQWLG